LEKIELEIMGLSSSQTATGSFALVLGETSGKRRLPIIIGMFEAQAIAMEIENIVPNRPMTHDLFKSFSEKFKFTISEIYISGLKEGVFYAKIVCSNGHEEFEIDSRPSDAVAVGIRFDVPIYTNEKILAEAGITMEEDEAKTEISNLTGGLKKVKKEKGSLGDKIKKASKDELNKMLAEAIKREEYEKAASIRDELGKRN
jgi:bifunctional DNase/RNase